MADDLNSDASEIPCPECGEMVRKGLVRCWNCGAFMDPELEAKFMEMQEDEPAVIYSDPSVAHADDSTFALASADDDGGDGDFELRVENRAGEGLEDIPETPEPSPPAAPEPAPKDELLEAAIADLKENQQRNQDRLRDGFVGGVKTAGGFIIFCPYGCKIEVKEKHRGQVGKCPKCQAPFIVPVEPPKFPAVQAQQTEEGPAAAANTGVYSLWLEGARLHTVDPEKLKLKADSLAKDFAPFELVVGPEHLALVPLVGPKGGLFGGGPKVDELRQQAKEAAAKEPFGDKFLEGDVIKLTADELRQLKLVQPTKSRGDSMFAGVPVFGQGRICVQLPDLPGRDKPDVISFSLTEFRKLANALSDQFGISNFGADVGVPLENEFFSHTCHYTDATIKALDKLDYYKADESVELILAGHQCAECGLVISEDARKKEGIGGKNGKGIAKAKCPKCGEKMGDQPLFTRAELVEATKMQSDT